MTANAGGTVTVTATIAGGAAKNTPFVSDFTISINDSFVTVSKISDVPAEAEVNAPLTLTATVTPSNATNKIIAWTIKDAGATGASIGNGNILTVKSAGAVVVTAAIANGASRNTPFTCDFTIAANTLEGWVASVHKEIEVLADSILASDNPNWDKLAEQIKDKKGILDVEVSKDYSFAVEYADRTFQGWLNASKYSPCDIKKVSTTLENTGESKSRFLLVDCVYNEEGNEKMQTVYGSLLKDFIDRGWTYKTVSGGCIPNGKPNNATCDNLN